MPTPVFQGLLFDLDGTLLDSAPDLAHAANQLYVLHHRPTYSMEILRPLAGEGSLGFIELGFGKDHPDLAELRQQFINLYLECFGLHTQLFDHVEQLIRYFQEINYPWGIVTNKPAYLTEVTLQRFNLLAQAKTVISGDTLAFNKPHPEPIRHACRQLKLQPQQCAYIGDHERDIIAGHQAGLYTIVAAYGYVPAYINPRSWRPNALINTIKDLYPYLPQKISA